VLNQERVFRLLLNGPRMPCPCCAPNTRVRRISRSSVPCRRATCARPFGLRSGPLASITQPRRDPRRARV